jgi:hypothetical protein
MGWFIHPIFPLGGGRPPQLSLDATPNGRLGVADATPRAPGGGSATPNGQTQNKKILGLAVGGGRTTPWGPRGGVSHPNPNHPLGP